MDVVNNGSLSAEEHLRDKPGLSAAAKGRAAAPCPYDLKRTLINNLLTAARSIISRENEDKRYSCKRSCIVPLFSHTFFPFFS
jgi:hypothetical protein